ncbi:MAG TPA: hypothetical protein VM843_08030 [Flavisolibacter sp.]|nr:hypothetical protein [Flavisolibacter sp.]
MDGSLSTDPDSNIAGYLWTKVSGPSSFSLSNPSGARTDLTDLALGLYVFELRVTDANGLTSIDTVQIEVNDGVVTRPIDTILTDLTWNHWHPSNFPASETTWDEIYLSPPIPDSLLLNVPNSRIKVYVRTDPGMDWIEARWPSNGSCNPPYLLQYNFSMLNIFSCTQDFSLVGKKASLRLVVQ